MNSNIFLISAALIFSLLSNSPISILAQINTPCSPTMLSSVTGCMSFLTGGGSSPTSDCCGALKSLTGTGMDCLCLIVTASVPINIPINRTLAISLPRACGMPGVPVQCKASAAPLPAPGPASFGPTTSPTDSQTSDPEGSASFGPPTSPTTSQNPNDQDYSGSGNGGDTMGFGPPPPSASSSSSHSLKLSRLLFAFVLMIIKFI
ncbi:non-specific lipid-transfer protein-like protein At5g64080 [Arabidopsis lyrata subsp. lyrata]|uniref:non-specific lipid-transfer protein-like protein At5g64080 n=1 Tax=Arabidopsis lyrata subsp. lyrata TaxID=81972 RepID=UPI000A29CE74|nr:non-specific lipid-transfer protein-like protein At5g64080 [Arabidopsis lyrata subsp. lyrata]|eukprot:XP_020868615.1 non-specific lipid-transfer protein-like protein At5g64080 [Arabidopsis lyrata subsp. lyrata]